MVKSYAPLLVEAALPLVDSGCHFGVLKKGGLLHAGRLIAGRDPFSGFMLMIVSYHLH